MKVLECTDRHMQDGVKAATKLLEDYGTNSVAILVVVTHKRGECGYHFSHGTNLDRLAMLGSLEEVKRKIQDRWEES